MNSPNNTPCPTDETMLSLLAGEIEDSTTENHIGNCGICQQRLARLASGEWQKFLPEDGKISIPVDSQPQEPTNTNRPLPEPPADSGSFCNPDDAVSTKIGRYELLREIARGGMGVVYKAIDPELNRPVALKLLSSDRLDDATWLDRFRREARLASALNHPNILTVYEVGSAGGIPYIVSEFVDGQTLKQIITAQPLSVETALDYALQIATGLATAHEADIIHRDLKPANVMIRKDGLAKILDFGLAKTHASSAINSDSEISRSGLIAGTIHYMSPEQTRGQPVETCSDIFSFGIVLFYLLTGERPFSGETPSDVSAAILTHAPRPVSDFNVHVPTEITRLVLECLSKNAAYRPTAQQIVDILKRPVHPAALATAQNSSVTAEFKPADAVADVTAMTGSNSSTAIDPAQLEPTQIRYARSGDINIAWQTIGTGPIDLVFVMGWVSHLD